MNNTIKPYVYICRHKVTQRYYIGYREKNVKLGIPALQDFPEYKTSSKIVRSDFHNYDWQIISECNTGNDAYDLEQKLISEAWGDPLLINKSCRYQSQTRFKAVDGEKCARLGKDNGMYGKEQNILTRDKISLKNKGKAAAKNAKTGEKLGRVPLTDPRWTTGEIIGQVKGRKDSDEVRQQKSKSLSGKTRSLTTKEKYRNVALNKMKNGTHPSQQLLTCPHCGFCTGIGNAKRHHFDNCRFKSCAE